MTDSATADPPPPTLLGLPITVLDRLREDTTSDRERELHTRIGAFVYDYSVAEICLDFILQFALRVPSFESYSLLTRGMDTRTKIERIMQINEREISIGPTLKALLDRMDKVSRTVRNKISHSIPRLHNGVIYFSDVSAMYDEFGSIPQAELPDRIQAVQLQREALWLRYLASDIIRALNQAQDTDHPGVPRTLEVISPVSGLPPEGQGTPLVRGRPARGDRRRGKRRLPDPAKPLPKTAEAPPS